MLSEPLLSPAFRKTLRDFYHNAYNGNRTEARGKLRKLKRMIRIKYVDEGREFDDIDELMDDIMYSISSGDKSNIDESITNAWSAVEGELYGRKDNPKEALRRVYLELSDIWLDFLQDPTKEKSQTVKKLLEKVQSIADEISRKEEEGAEEWQGVRRRLEGLYDALGRTMAFLPHIASAKKSARPFDDLFSAVNSILSFEPGISPEERPKREEGEEREEEGKVVRLGSKEEARKFLDMVEGHD